MPIPRCILLALLVGIALAGVPAPAFAQADTALIRVGDTVRVKPGTTQTDPLVTVVTAVDTARGCIVLRIVGPPGDPMQSFALSLGSGAQSIRRPNTAGWRSVPDSALVARGITCLEGQR